MYVKPKKKLGQHFLTDKTIARDLARAIIYRTPQADKTVCLEIGPGTGILTEQLLDIPDLDLSVIEIDRESVEYLTVNFPKLYNDNKIIGADFLNVDLNELFPQSLPVICGNFPYNISSQIFFKILEYKETVKEVVCMLQREVAVRLANKPGTKEYGILSVFLQAYFDIDYLFDVDNTVFNPPPKVQSAVIRLRRNDVIKISCDEKFFRKVVKESFNMRRKMLRNSLKQYFRGLPQEEEFLTKRPEELSVDDFIRLTNLLSS